MWSWPCCISPRRLRPYICVSNKYLETEMAYSTIIQAFSFFVSVKKKMSTDSHVAEPWIHNIASLLCLKKLLCMTILKGHKTKLTLMLIHEMKLKSPYPDDHCLTASTCNVSLLLISFFAARERITSMEFLIWSSVANTWPKTKKRKMATLKTELKVKLNLYLRPA